MIVSASSLHSLLNFSLISITTPRISGSLRILTVSTKKLFEKINVYKNSKYCNKNFPINPFAFFNEELHQLSTNLSLEPFFLRQSIHNKCKKSVPHMIISIK